ncbi:hypothetical protein B5807_11599 [Epicoccum nigrum]|uniref:Uncharacterized protein n=1 Tax=Epicoccum nigrum TaxID=105696 RepID=A0A1Y2LJ56_EPING|nr:hypothetical protein B5807_11599 [Epicoccum nigrum]
MRRAQNIARYTEATDSIKKDSDPGFTARLLKDTRYEGAHMTPKKDSDGNSKEDVEDINNADMRMQIDDTTRLMDNHGYQPRDYRKALQYARVASRKRPIIPGQNPDGNFNLWWQMTGAYESNHRRDYNSAKMLRQRQKFIESGHPFPDQAAFRGVSTGAVIADEVGIRKSDTCSASVLMRNNNRKFDLQDMYTSNNVEGLAAYPKPRPTLVVTQPHLLLQLAKSFALYSDTFHVYIYGGNSTDLPPNVTRVNEKLTRDHEFFDEENEHNCQVIIVTSYPTLSSRHGPAANKK